VLVFGESAGAVDTCVQLASPRAAGLFSAALMESGGCGDPTLAQAETDQAGVSATLGCTTLECLRGLPATTVVQKVPGVVSVSGLDAGIKWGPNVDGVILPAAPIVRLRAGTYNQVPFVVGANSDETARAVPMVADAQTYADLIHATFGPTLGDLVLAQYPASAYATPRKALIAVTTDARFVCPARKIARAARGAPGFRYFFSHALDSGVASSFGAWHGLELLFVFRHLEIAGYVPSAGERALSDAMAGFWARFAATGDPGWPAYDPATDRTQRLDDPLAVEDGIRTAQCDFWDSLIP